MKPFLLGLAASFFFSLTFLLNRSMDLEGGFWVWSGVLRFAFMVPLLLMLLPWNGGYAPLWKEIRRAPGSWWLWSTVGFGLFYAPMCWAAAFGEGWLVAGLWQVTIVAGVLLFARQGLPKKTLALSLVILVGVGFLQGGQALRTDGASAAAVGLLVLVGAVAYPWGNRKLMALVEDRLTTVQRVTGMTLMSLPFWGLLAAVALAVGETPSASQVGQSFLVALFSGVIATLLFFRATELVRGDASRLGAVEATQAGEVVFALGGEMLVLGAPWPDLWSTAGLVLIVGAMAAQGVHAKPRTR